MLARTARVTPAFLGSKSPQGLRPHPEMLTLPPDFTFFIHLGTFLVLFLVLSRLLFAPFIELLAERDARTTGDIASAAASRAEVNSLLSYLDAELAKAREREYGSRSDSRDDARRSRCAVPQSPARSS